MEIKTVGVAGAGHMGSGIAQVFAQAGIPVRLYDVDRIPLSQARRNIQWSLDKFVKHGTLTPLEGEAVLERITFTEDLEDLAGPGFVLESVVEDFDVKAELFRELDRICPPQAVLASNTSAIPITRLGGKTRRPGKVVGMHFMNPAQMMPLVEVVRGLETDEVVYRFVETLARRLGKEPVPVNDRPGFIANRILMPMINEAIFAFEGGVAKAEDIDRIVSLGMNHPMGPLALADLIGLDTCLAILVSLQKEFGDGKYRPCSLLRRMVDAGRLGRKSGRGFFDYPDEES